MALLCAAKEGSCGCVTGSLERSVAGWITALRPLRRAGGLPLAGANTARTRPPLLLPGLLPAAVFGCPR